MIAIKSIKHIAFLFKNKAVQTRLNKNDFILIAVLIALIASSFYAENLYSALSNYAFIIPIILSFLYLSMMCLTMLDKMPAGEYKLFKYLKFTEIDFLLLSYLKTIITNISMSIVIANFLIYWRINFGLCFLLTFILGNIVVFYLYKLIITKSEKNNGVAVGRKGFTISNCFIKNKYTAFFCETFFGYKKGRYEYVDMVIIFISIIAVMVIGVYYQLAFIITIYLLTFFSALLSIDVYMVHFKNRALYVILGISKSEIYKMSLAVVTSLSVFFNLICLILYFALVGFEITYVLICVICLLYFIPIQYALIKTANKKLSVNSSAMSAFLTDIMASFVPLFNLIYAGFILVTNRSKKIERVKNAGN